MIKFPRPTMLGIVCALACVATAAPVHAQDSLVFGDVEGYLQDAVAGENETLASVAGLSANGQLLSGGVKLHISQRLTFDAGELYVDDSLTCLSGSDGLALSNQLHQGYIAITPIPALTVVIGKRRMAWGSGYAFFPGDRIDPPLSPGSQSDGFYGVLATVSPSASFTLTGAVRFDTAFPELDSLSGFSSNSTGSLTSMLSFLASYVPSQPANPWARLRYALYADALIGKLDLYGAVTYQYREVLRPTLGFSLDLGGVIANGEAALELSNNDLYPANGTPAFSTPAFGTPFPVLAFGLQRSVSGDAGSYSITAEYLYDGTGYTTSQAESFYNDLLPALSALGGGGAAAAAALRATYAAGYGSSSAWIGAGDVLPALGRQYAALSASISVTNVVEATAAAMVNLQDWSFALQPEIRTLFLSGVDLFLRAIVTWGRNDHTEFGLDPTPITISTGASVSF